jgi:GT2 family glycosyltransferase
MAKVVAIMVNWNGGALAVESATSVTRQSVRPVLWVVDNDSKDGSIEAIERVCPAARVLRNRTNQGFAAGNNQALRRIGDDAEYILLVNNDVVLPDATSLARVVAYLDAHPDVQAACGRYEYPDGRFQHFYIQLPTLFDLFVWVGIGRHVRPLLYCSRTRRFYLHDRNFARPMFLEAPAFACVLLRGKCARYIGLMDEQFPINFNDVDYCWRWRKAGWTWRYFPDWPIVHYGSRSVGKMGGWYNADMAVSAVRFARKHYPWPAALFIRLAVLGEAAWRKYRHGDMPVPLKDIWHGKLFFRSDRARTEPAAPTSS